MAKPITIPNTFANATSVIPLSQLDTNYSTIASNINDAATYSNYASDTGSANTYVITFSGVTTTYTAGTRFQFRATSPNTGASTLNVNGQGAKNIFLGGVALGANTILANSIVDVIYDGTQFALMSTDSVVTSGSTQSLTNKTLTGTRETVFTITDAAAFEVDPANGGIQSVTLGASRTPKATNFLAGQSVTLMVNDGTAYTLTWTDTTWGPSGVVWVGGTAPTLATTGFTVLEFWKLGSQVYGALVGSVA